MHNPYTIHFSLLCHAIYSGTPVELPTRQVPSTSFTHCVYYVFLVSCLPVYTCILNIITVGCFCVHWLTAGVKYHIWASTSLTSTFDSDFESVLRWFAALLVFHLSLLYPQLFSWIRCVLPVKSLKETTLYQLKTLCVAGGKFGGFLFSRKQVCNHWSRTPICMPVNATIRFFEY